uniref:Uncharacterized protein n=1 Tax=Lotharella vacuolata TaxID=74820 RepID=A0A0H5BHK7_9EUKA|nr:hypothetical protein [Lotharella vacuolata]
MKDDVFVNKTHFKEKIHTFNISKIIKFLIIMNFFLLKFFNFEKNNIIVYFYNLFLVFFLIVKFLFQIESFRYAIIFKKKKFILKIIKKLLKLYQKNIKMLNYFKKNISIIIRISLSKIFLKIFTIKKVFLSGIKKFFSYKHFINCIKKNIDYIYNIRNFFFFLRLIIYFWIKLFLSSIFIEGQYIVSRKIMVKCYKIQFQLYEKYKENNKIEIYNLTDLKKLRSLKNFSRIYFIDRNFEKRIYFKTIMNKKIKKINPLQKRYFLRINKIKGFSNKKIKLMQKNKNN